MLLRLTDHGGASGQRCFCALVEVISRGHPHDGHLQPGMDVDPPRHDELAVGINCLDTTGNKQVFSNLSENGIKISRSLSTALK